MNQMDEWAIEEAVQQKEEHGGEVVVASIGSEDATKEIRTGLAMGGDRGILVETDTELDSDTVARILAEIAKKEEPDLITLGKLSLDTDRNQTAQLLAGYLDWPQATFAYDVNIEDGWAEVGREIDGGVNKKRFELPGVISAIERLNEPRYASLPNIMQAKQKELETLAPEDLGVDVSPKIQDHGFELPPEREAGEVVENVDELIDRLENDANVL
jgi:electron transfer flavoprotein beta subunit